MGQSHNLDTPSDRPDTVADVTHEIAALLDGFSVEVTADEVLSTPYIPKLVPQGTHVYLPLLPNRTLAESIPAAQRLARDGMVPVPHIAARRLTSEAELTDALHRLRDTANVTSVLVIAGDTDEVAGPYPSSLHLLESGILENFGITDIGIAGYPEPHPLIPEKVVREYLTKKHRLAQSSTADFRIVSQFTFSHQSIVDWTDQLRQDGVSLPVVVSVPGPARLRTLLAYAKRCGVSTSLRQLTRNRKTVLGLATVGAPDQVLTGLARHRQSTQRSSVAGVLFNVFGGFQETARWIEGVKDRRVVMNRTGTGFSVNTQ